MSSRGRVPRARCWQARQLNAGAVPAGSFGRSRRPPPHLAKDLLGAVVTIALVGLILLFVLNGAAAPCDAAPPRRAGAAACSGIAAVASHVRGIGTIFVFAIGALAVTVFIWYLLWGYNTAGRAGHRGDQDQT
jgi:hypothetical protein